MLFQRALLLLASFSVFNGAAAARDLMEGFSLKPDAKSLKQTLSGNVITTLDGKEFPLDGNLVPETDMFSPEYFIPSDDGSRVFDIRTSEMIDVRVARATYDDGTVILVTKNDEGEIEYAEVYRKSTGDTPNPDTTILVKNGPIYETFEETSLDEELGTSSKIDGISPPIDGGTDGGRNLRLQAAQENKDTLQPSLGGLRLRGQAPKEPESNASARDLEHYYKAWDGTDSECTDFRTVKISIVFDEQYCSMKGGETGAINHIQQVVGGASMYYQNDMCVKLQLVAIRGVCDRKQDVFRGMNTDNACTSTAEGQPRHFLSQFAEYVRENRKSLNIDGGSSVHIFTGADIRSPAVGCAYTGTLCNADWAMGVDYMQAGNLHSQKVMFAHEQGHIMGLTHQSGGENIMRASLSNGSSGFTRTSINIVMDKLDNVGCDSLESVSGSPPTPPTPSPPTPSSNPKSGGCNDDSSWRYVNKRGKKVSSKDCDWVSQKSKRCNKYGEVSNGSNTKAKDACRAACGTC